MTEPKEEKCEACYGSGYINFWTDDGHISMRTCRRCDGYGYIKVKQQTNEEWLRTATTEQLAEFLYDIAYFDNWSDAIMNDSLINETAVEDAIEKWLKQPHTNE